MHFPFSPTRRAFMLQLLAASAGAQMLSRPGWRGTGLTPEAWWQHAILVRLPAATTFATANAMLDAVIEVGADSILLPDPAPATGSPMPFAEHFGTEEDLDALLRETTARRMHVLFTASVSRLAANPAEVRFWMNRGIGGFDAGTITAVDTGSLSLLRASLHRSAGQRVVMAKLPGWLPGALPPAQLSTASAMLEYGRNDYVGISPAGFAVDMYFSKRAAGRGTDSEVPVLDSTSIETVEQRAAVRQWLSHRGRAQKDAAIPTDPHAPPRHSAHRRPQR